MVFEKAKYGKVGFLNIVFCNKLPPDFDHEMETLATITFQNWGLFFYV
jgi:hypothetical protein